MKRKKKEERDLLLIFFTVLAFMGLSWITTCGVVKLLSICFKFQFDWFKATGAWGVIFWFCNFMLQKKAE